MLDTFLKQTIAVLVTAIFAALVIGFATTAMFIIKPQVERAADFTAHTLQTINQSFDQLDKPKLRRIVETLKTDSGLNVQASLEPPDTQEEPEQFLARYFKKALEARYQMPDGATVVVGADGKLWVRINMAQQPLWLSVKSGTTSDPLQNLVLVAALTFAIALFAGIALQRHVTRPLKELEDHVRQFHDPNTHTPLPKTGVREIAAVSDAFNQMANRLKLTEADRAVMLAGVSHDLRTPLTKLRLSLDMLHDADEELITSAKRQVDRIETMLVQFLEYARGFDAEELKATSLSALLDSAIKTVDLTGKVNIDLPEDAIVSIRQGALLRALGNLMTNAMRYGKSPVRVSARISGTFFTLEVFDSGTGLEPDQAKALIRPFARGNSARTGDGTGLGLAIAEQAAIAHGGKLDFVKCPTGFRAALQLPSHCVVLSRKFL